MSVCNYPIHIVDLPKMVSIDKTGYNKIQIERTQIYNRLLNM
jgi:hypothetical protein